MLRDQTLSQQVEGQLLLDRISELSARMDKMAAADKMAAGFEVISAATTTSVVGRMTRMEENLEEVSADVYRLTGLVEGIALKV